jgi:hypothetical protein
LLQQGVEERVGALKTVSTVFLEAVETAADEW